MEESKGSKQKPINLPDVTWQLDGDKICCIYLGNFKFEFAAERTRSLAGIQSLLVKEFNGPSRNYISKVAIAHLIQIGIELNKAAKAAKAGATPKP